MPEQKAMWAGIAKQAISFIVGVIVAAFILGRNSQKINDVVLWKTEAGPRIERMDRAGTVSFELFHKEYEKTQTRQEAALTDLNKEIRVLERHWNLPMKENNP